MPRFSRAQMLLMSAAADHDAVELLATVAAEQAPEAPGWVDWSPYEALLQRATANVETAEWASRFRRRYLDFSPVAHLLAGDDPRVTGERRQPIGDPFCLAQLDEALTQLRSIGGRVLGFHEVASGSILNQVESALSGQRLDQARLVDLALMTRRVRDAAEALRITRADASSVWSAIETPPHA